MLYLASQSEIRRTLLTNAGVPFCLTKTSFDERQAQAQSSATSAEALASNLALNKALGTIEANSAHFVLGVDQVLSCESKILHKPIDHANARAQLQFLRGKTHQLTTALSIVSGNQEVWSHSDKATMKMRNFSDQFLDSYISRVQQQVLMSVGCYQIENLGLQLFEEIHGDHHTILGLPLLPLLNKLRDLGIIES